MTYKQIETSREIRQWIGIIVPAALFIATNEQLKTGCKNLYFKGKRKFYTLIRKN